MTRGEFFERRHEFQCRGSQLPQSKLTEDAVREIRRNARRWSARQWAEHYALHICTIEAVRYYRTWRHVR